MTSCEVYPTNTPEPLDGVDRAWFMAHVLLPALPGLARSAIEGRAMATPGTFWIE